MLRYLAEAGLLERVRVISAVSGGSILAAMLTDRWSALEAEGFTAAAFERHVHKPLRLALAEHNFRNRGLVRWAGRRATLRGPARGAVVVTEIIEHLCRARRVTELPESPQTIFTSTDLGTGQAVRISQQFTGLFAYGYVATSPDLPLATAVAASAAVPLLFSPVRLRIRDLGASDAPEVISLTDGGVYDNLGLEWFQGWDRGRPARARSVDEVLVVDASGPLTPRPGPTRGLQALMRTRDVMYWTGRATRTRWFVDQLLSGAMRGLHLGIRVDPRIGRRPDRTPYPSETYDGALPSELISPLSAIRTDLDRFSVEESSLLAYHAYWLTHARMANLRPEDAVAHPTWREFAELSRPETGRLVDLLGRGARRRLS